MAIKTPDANAGMMNRGIEMYRPEGWVDVSNDAVERLKKQGVEFNPACFIAGADAMLEGLKKEGITMDNYNPVNTTVAETAQFLNQAKDGVLIFIPKEKE